VGRALLVDAERGAFGRALEELVVGRCVTFLSIGCVRRHGILRTPGRVLQHPAADTAATPGVLSVNTC
jgi:hypothetical protein